MVCAPIPEGMAMLTLRAFGALDLRDAEGAPLGTVLAQIGHPGLRGV
jgi:hypothetical protein